jgi:hypothetical protein
MVKIMSPDKNITISPGENCEVLPLGADKYVIFLTGNLENSEDFGKQISRLEGATLLNDHTWEVGPSDLLELFIGSQH